MLTFLWEVYSKWRLYRDVRGFPGIMFG